MINNPTFKKIDVCSPVNKDVNQTAIILNPMDLIKSL